MVASPVENHSIVILKLEHKVIPIFIELSKVVHTIIPSTTCFNKGFLVFFFHLKVTKATATKELSFSCISLMEFKSLRF